MRHVWVSLEGLFLCDVNVTVIEPWPKCYTWLVQVTHQGQFLPDQLQGCNETELVCNGQDTHIKHFLVLLWMKIAETTIFCQYLFHCNISVTYSSEGHVKVMKVISRTNADFTLKRSPIHSKNRKRWDWCWPWGYFKVRSRSHWIYSISNDCKKV